MAKKIWLILFLNLIILIIGGAIFLSRKPSPPLPSPTKERELNIFNWEDYLSEEVIKDFEAKFGIEVNLDTFGESEEMFSVLQSQPDKYDLVVTDDRMVILMKNLKLLSPLDHSQLPNLKYLKPQMKENAYDPGNIYCLPYVSGFTGIAINEKHVKDFDGRRKILWDEKYKGKISLPNISEEVLFNALFYLGYSINTPNQNQLEEAINLVLKQKPLVIGYDDPIRQRELLINEEAWIAYIYSTEIEPIQRINPDIKFFAPKEGVLLWTDNWCIPKDAPHKTAAHQFLNYLFEPEVNAKNSQVIGVMTVNEKAQDFLSAEFKKRMEGLDFPLEEETFSKSQYFTEILDIKIREAVNRLEAELFTD